jgi:hypothetical protein
VAHLRHPDIRAAAVKGTVVEDEIEAVGETGITTIARNETLQEPVIIIWASKGNYTTQTTLPNQIQHIYNEEIVHNNILQKDLIPSNKSPSSLSETPEAPIATDAAGLVLALVVEELKFLIRQKIKEIMTNHCEEIRHRLVHS